MSLELICPRCSEPGFIDHRTDSWTTRSIEGLNDDGSVKLGEPEAIEYDYNLYSCDNCGRKFTEEEIVVLIKETQKNGIQP